MALNLKLGARMILGFSAILLLVVLTAGVGWFSLNSVVEKADKALGVDMLDAGITKTAMLVKDYQLQANADSVPLIEEQLARLLEEVAARKQSFKQEANRARMDDMSAKIQAYGSDFALYAKTGNELRALQESMQNQAGEVLLIVEKIRMAQSSEMRMNQALSTRNQNKIMQRVNDAREMLELLLTSRVLESQMVATSDTSRLKEFRQLQEEIGKISEKLDAGIEDEQSKQLLETLRQAHNAYATNLEEYLKFGGGDLRKKMEDASGLALEQMKQMAEYQMDEANQAKRQDFSVSQKLLRASSKAEMLSKQYLETRILEKEMLLT